VRLDTTGAYSPSIERNELVCRLVPNGSAARWDCYCERRYSGQPNVAPDHYGDAVDALDDSELRELDERDNEIGPKVHPPTQLTLERGRTTRYRIVGAYCRSVAEAERIFGVRWAPYAWQGLMNRYASADVHLEIRAGAPNGLRGAFASETDLGTGLQQPLPLAPESNDDVVVIHYRDCPPRTLLRVYWPLESATEPRLDASLPKERNAAGIES
jgi:hypothetical protein